MAKIYYDLIKINMKKIEDVPTRWRADVQAMLESDVTE
ncbi:CD1375 family protein [Paenibacillus dendrobii]|nr:CD1375 family protein [Paenibacillus dendrobii]